MHSPADRQADNAQRYYDEHSGDYAAKWSRIDAEPDRPAHVYRKEIISALLELAAVSAGDRVVEIGCGTGLVLRELLGKTAPVWGTDISAAMLERAREDLSQSVRVAIVDSFDEPPPADVLLIQGDLLGLELPQGAFDRILSMEVLRYIQDLDAALRSVRSAMNDDTVFAFTVTNLWSASLFPVKYALRRKLGRVDAGAELLQYFVTERGIRHAVARNGFELLELRKLNLLTFSPIGRWTAKGRRGAERLVTLDRTLEKVPLVNRAFDTLLLAVRKR